MTKPMNITGNPVYKAGQYEMAVQLGVTEVRLAVPSFPNDYDWLPVGQIPVIPSV
jgi:hypothetical protein